MASSILGPDLCEGHDTRHKRHTCDSIYKDCDRGGAKQRVGHCEIALQWDIGLVRMDGTMEGYKKQETGWPGYTEQRPRLRLRSTMRRRDINGLTFYSFTLRQMHQRSIFYVQ